MNIGREIHTRCSVEEGEMSVIDLKAAIKLDSLAMSRQRKCRDILFKSNLDYFLDNAVNSSDAEMTSDWHHACVCWVDGLMTGRLKIESLQVDSFRLLDRVWIDDLKKHLAYCRWLDSHSDDDSAAFRENHYFNACQTLRDRLVNEAGKATKAARLVVLEYAKQRIVTADAKQALVDAKQKRLPAGSPPLAKAYVHTFYTNIVPAMSGDEAATIKVLEALRSGCGKSLPTAEIADGFETLLAVCFLDAKIVAKHPALLASTF